MRRWRELKEECGDDGEDEGGVGYMSTCVLVQVAEAGEIEVESARDLLGVSENSIDVVVGAHA